MCLVPCVYITVQILCLLYQSRHVDQKSIEEKPTTYINVAFLRVNNKSIDYFPCLWLVATKKKDKYSDIKIKYHIKFDIHEIFVDQYASVAQLRWWHASNKGFCVGIVEGESNWHGSFSLKPTAKKIDNGTSTYTHTQMTSEHGFDESASGEIIN